MKFFNFIIINILFTSVTYSQDSLSYEFIGALSTTDQQIISYKINFKEIGKGEIEGVSITDFYGVNNTKSKIIGSIDLKNNKLSFKEVSNISTKSSDDEETFCFVHVTDLKIRSVKGKRIMQGEFIGKFNNGEDCALGSIYLVGAELLKELNINNDSLRKLDSLMKIQHEEFKTVQFLKRNDKLNVIWKGDDVVFNVWDGSKEDNDRVNIYFNDKIILENLLITNLKKNIKIPFTGSKGILRILALNEGEAGMNSVNFELINGDNLIPVMSNLKKKEEVYIEFNR
jgi:hypothetical protein